MPNTATVLHAEHTPEGLDVVCDTGGGANVTAEHFGPAGDDSPPLPGDTVALKDGTGAGRKHAVGYDDDTPKTALPGEKRIYGRDADGMKVNEIHMKRDGTIEIGGGECTFRLSKGELRVTARTIHLDSPDVLLGKGGHKIATMGSAVAVAVFPPPDWNPAEALPTDPPLPGVGKVISGISGVRAG